MENKYPDYRFLFPDNKNFCSRLYLKYIKFGLVKTFINEEQAEIIFLISSNSCNLSLSDFEEVGSGKSTSIFSSTIPKKGVLFSMFFSIHPLVKCNLTNN